MRSLSAFFFGVVFALLASPASAQDIAIEIDQAFTAHPERFGLSTSPAVEIQAAITPAPAATDAAEQTTPIGEVARDEVAREQGDGETRPWEGKDHEEDEATH